VELFSFVSRSNRMVAVSQSCELAGGGVELHGLVCPLVVVVVRRCPANSEVTGGPQGSPGCPGGVLPVG